MTGDEHIEKASGPVNGFNQTFTVSLPYQPGTLKLFVNGQLREITDDDGWTESNPSVGEFQMIIPPDNDKIFARYLEA